MPTPIKRVTSTVTEYFDPDDLALDEELNGEDADEDEENKEEPAAFVSLRLCETETRGE